MIKVKSFLIRISTSLQFDVHHSVTTTATMIGPARIALVAAIIVIIVVLKIAFVVLLVRYILRKRAEHSRQLM